MNRVLRLLGVLFLCSLPAWAAGGTCPSGATYTNPANPTGSLVALSSLGITSCYFVAANGSDSNDGLSEASGHPWLHAPFMPNCSSVCATAQTAMNGSAAAGLGIIMRGGDVWNFGASTSPASGGEWNFNTVNFPYGTPTHPIYIGVDSVWYSGSSWVRPVLNGNNSPCGPGTTGTMPDGATCTAGTDAYGQPSYSVSSCVYQTGSSNNFTGFDSFQYFWIDNLEMTGMCQNKVNQNIGSNIYVNYSGLCDYSADCSGSGPVFIATNLYIHGFSHVAYAGENNSATCNTNTVVCINNFAFQGSIANGSVGEELVLNVVDYADSDPAGENLNYDGFYNVAYNVFRYTTQSIDNPLHVFHDNLYEYYFENGHSNMLESAENNTINAIYNNTFRHADTYLSSGNAGLLLWPGPKSGVTDYIFNNVAYDVGYTQYLDIGGDGLGPNAGNYVFFNNVWQSNVAQVILRCGGQGTYGGTTTDTNNYYVNDQTPYQSCPSLNTNTSLCQSNSSGGTSAACPLYSDANVTPKFDQYTSSETFGYSPVASTNSTVGVGTNETSGYCATLLASGDALIQAAGTACKSDTSYGVSYNATTHTVSFPARTENSRPSSGAWDIGAYEYAALTNYTLSVTVSGSGSVSSSPSGISCPSTCSASYSSGTVVTLTETPSGGYTFTGWSGGGCSGAATTCAVTMSAAESVTATFVSAPVLSLTVTGSGVVTSSPVGILCPGTCSNNFTSGTNITLSAVASGSYVFSGWYGGGCSGTLTCSLTLTANTSITAVFAQTGTPSLLTNNLTATSTACAIASNIVTITASNTFTANSWIGLSGFTTCTQLNGQILLTNSSTNSTKVVGTLYNVQKVAQTLSNLSTTSDTTGYLQGQGWNPFVTAPFPLCNGSPSCVVTPTVGTWAYDFSIPGPGSDNAPTSPIVAIADYGVSATSLSVSASGESYDHEISLPDGSGNYMYCLVNSGRCDIFSGHVDSSVCNNVPCFVPDVVLDSKAWNHTPVNYGAFSRNLTKRPGTHKALWYSLYESTPYASPFWLKSDVLSYSANQVTSTLTTNLYDISTCPGFGYVTIGTGLAFSGALITDNFDDKVEFILGSGTQGGPGRHMQFVVSLTNGTCETLDTDGMTGTAVYTYGVTNGHGGTSYTNGDTITGAYGDTYTATVSGGVVTALTQVTAGTGASLGQGNATTGGTGTGLEYDVTGIGTIGTYATLYAPISSASCPAGTTLTCEAPITTGIYTFGIHAGGMLSNGQYTWLSGWGTSGQPGQCTGCDYVIWSVGTSPTLTGTTSGNQNGHPSGGFNWLGTASNPNYYLNRFLGAISDPTCANLSDCQLLYTLPSGGTGGNCSVSPGGSQMHSAVSTILNDDSLPILVTSSINTPGTPTQTNPPNFTCGLGQNSLFSIAKTGGTTWYAHHYENGNNHAGEQFEGTDTICTESPDAVFAICDEDMNYGFPGNTGLGSSLSSAAEPFSFMLNMGIPVIPYPSPMFGFF